MDHSELAAFFRILFLKNDQLSFSKGWRGDLERAFPPAAPLGSLWTWQTCSELPQKSNLFPSKTGKLSGADPGCRCRLTTKGRSELSSERLFGKQLPLFLWIKDSPVPAQRSNTVCRLRRFASFQEIIQWQSCWPDSRCLTVTVLHSLSVGQLGGTLTGLNDASSLQGRVGLQFHSHQHGDGEEQLLPSQRSKGTFHALSPSKCCYPFQPASYR